MAVCYFRGLKIPFLIFVGNFVTGVTLSIHEDKRCNGHNVSLEIIQKKISCKLLTNQIENGVLLTWSYSQLGECLNTSFDVNIDNIHFEIRTDLEDDYCSKEFVIDINNGVLFENTFKKGKKIIKPLFTIYINILTSVPSVLSHI